MSIDKYFSFLYYALIDNDFLLRAYMKLTANRIAGILREQGYKLTPQRHAVLKAIASSHDYLSPETIFEIAHISYPRLGLVTVYRTLDILSELNLVCRIHSVDGNHGYMMCRPTEHHHHLICSKCSKAVDFTGCTIVELEQKLKQETGFTINGHLLEFYGLCPECRLAAAQP
jgi:Fur family transcriptional regulator, ferric uptake regulator